MILKLYTQLPRCYPDGIPEMTAQLESIATMGFNAVWVNPLHLTGQKEVQRYNIAVKGSLYAMRSQEHFNPRFFAGNEEDKHNHPNYQDLLRDYVKQARLLGLIPLFDLVLGQVAAEEDRDIIPFRDPLAWKFKNELVQTIKQSDDIRKFQYAVRVKETETETKEIQDRVFEELWKPFIEKYITDYGFQGVRIDAVKWVPRHLLTMVCAYIKGLCPGAIILGELLDRNPSEYVPRLQNQGLTHVNNSLAHTPFTLTARKQDKKQGGWNASDGMLNTISQIRQIGLDFGGGSVGYSGNHDELSLSLSVLKDNKLETAPGPHEFMRLAREKLFGIVLSSDAGWYALAGDEFLIDRRSYMVFDDYQPASFTNTYHQMDLRGFMTSINTLLLHLPKPTVFWVEHYIPEATHLNIAIRHTEAHNSPTDIVSVVCARIDGQLIPDSDLKDLFCSLHKMLDTHLTKTDQPPKSNRRLFILDDAHLVEQDIITKKITDHREPIKQPAATFSM